MQRVEKLIPSYYAKLRDSKQKTAEELFNDMHKEQLLAAQQWAKETSQSCSAVAVLVATIVFAAAYTVPGGSNDKGIPIFLN
jgi:DNA-binding MurR/RpiR family transcriptional regulator